MKTLALGAVFVGVLLTLQGQPTSVSLPSDVQVIAAHSVSPEAGQPGTPAPAAPATLTEVVQKYCVVCHNDQLLTGNQSFQAFDVERAGEKAEQAEKMIRKLRAGMMPPPGMLRPGGDTLLQLAQTLESKVDEAARAAPNYGDRRFSRLSQAEYERAIKDLLAIDVDAAQWLPPDVLVGSFDNMSAAQALTTTLVDAFVRAAIEVTRLALGNSKAVSVTHQYANKDVVSQHAWDHIEGAPFGTRGGMVVTHDFPADGEYVFSAATSMGNGNKILWEDLDISIDGEPVALLLLPENGSDGGGAQNNNNNNFDNRTTGGLKTEPIFVKAGQHQVAAAFVNQIDGAYEDRFKPIGLSSAAGGAGAGNVTGLAHLTSFEITGPTNVSGVSETESRQKVFTCRPAAGQERSCAQTILTRLATQAYRRPVNDTDLAMLMTLYDEGAAEDGFEGGVAKGLQAILVSPEFLFRLERMPANTQPGTAYRLSDMDLATRISFFLWDAAPDAQLLDAAAKGRLSNPAELDRQVQRMLKDPRAEALATRFAHLWLRLQDVERVPPDPMLFPDFSAQTGAAMVKETEEFFKYLIREDRGVLDIFGANYTFINEDLAKYYGIPGVVGPEFRRVEYPATAKRQGILGHGSVLKLTSMAARTSPVLRGKWVMEVLMGTPPPPPPPNVPAFDQTAGTAGGRRLTTRERMEQHRKNPVCSSCHNFIDPIGLALDNFDATGRLRIRENGAPLDTRGTYYDGTDITSPNELVSVLLKRPVPLARNFTEHLLSYAIGRPVYYYDQPAIRAITRSAEGNGYKMSSIVMGIVKSDVFQMKQVQSTSN
jgi:hypothetical protein